MQTNSARFPTDESINQPMKNTCTALLLTILALLCTLHARAQSSIPFVPTTIENGQFAKDTHWYSIYVRGQKYLYVDTDLFAETGSANIYCGNTTAPTDEKPNYLWTLVGNSTDGYRMYNYVLGPSYHLGAASVANDVYPSMTASTTNYETFKFRANTKTPGGFNMYAAGTSFYLNDKSNLGTIGFWNATDASSSQGGCMVFAEVEVTNTGGGDTGGSTVNPDDKLASALSSLISEAQAAYDANSSYDADELIRTESQLYSEHSQNDLGTTPDGGSLGTLIDGDASTYWHSYWQGGTVTAGTHYLRVTAPDDLGTFPSDNYTVSLTYRDGGNDHPTQFTVYGTNSLTSTGGWGGGKPGSNTSSWTQIGNLNFNFGGRGTTSTATLSLPTTYKYLRFNCTATSYNRGYFHLAEFQLYNQTSLSPSCPNALYPEAAKTLADALAEAQAALDAYNQGSGTLSQSNIDALQAALDTYVYSIPTLVKTLTISPTNYSTYNVGSTFSISANVQPYNATNASLSWTTSDSSVATVDAQGNVTTNGTGYCVITATTTDGTNLSASCEVNVYGQIDYSGLIINEVQAANIDQYLDPSFNYGGWIELYNTTDHAIPLEGLYVAGTSASGKAEVPFQFIFPDDDRYDYGYVPAHGFKNIWFDHYATYPNKPITEHEAYKQVDWKLDIDGGRVALLAGDGATEICAVQYPAMPPRSSYARTTDGGDEWAFHVCGSPAASNSSVSGYIPTAQRLPAPEVSTESQILSGAITTFTVTIPEGATLRYTTNGSTPTAASAQSTTGRFTVQSYASTTYRFRLFQDGWLSSPVVTRSFIYNKNSGYNLPIMVVSTADEGLNNSSYGILTKNSLNGRTGLGSTVKSNRNMDWERPVNFEYFNLRDGSYDCVVNHEADIAVAGGWSRFGSNPPPFKIKAAEQYEGHKYFHYPIFSDKPYNKNRVLQLRCETDLLDVGLQEIVRRSGLDLDAQAWEPAELYINGTSYGYRPIREPNNKHFALANYGIDTDEVDVFEIGYEYNYEQSAGTIDAFNRWYDLAAQCGTDKAAYRELCDLVDVEEFLNYMAAEFYIFNTDWPWNNVKGFRPHDGKFRMVLMDVGDQAFAHSGGHASSSDSPFEYFRQWKDRHYSGYGETRIVSIFFNMMQNEEIRRKFVDTYCLMAYSVYDPDFVSEVMADVHAKCNNWVYDSRIKSTLTANWQRQAISHLVKLPEAGISTSEMFSITLQPDVEGARLHLNGLPIPRQRFKGNMFAPVTLHAEAPAGYTFTGWKDASGNTLCTDADWTIAEGRNTNYGAVYASFTPEAAPDAVPPVRINEVSAANNIYVNELWDRKDWVELYNTTNSAIDVAGMYLSDNASKPMKWKIPAVGDTSDDGSFSSASTIIPAHGTLIVWCDKEPAGTQLHANFKLSNNDGCLVRISDADGTWSDQLSYKAHGERESFGRYPDGGECTLLFKQPTIDAPNRSGFLNFQLLVKTTIGVIVNTIDRLLKGETTIDEVNDAVTRTLNNE